MIFHSPNPISLLPAWHTVESSSGVSQPQRQPRPVFSAASTSCLQEGQAATPSFHFLWWFLSLGVLEWTGLPQAWILQNSPPRSLGNWFHSLPLVSCPWTVQCVIGCRLLPESCSYTLFTGPAVFCVVILRWIKDKTNIFHWEVIELGPAEKFTFEYWSCLWLLITF